MCGFNVDYLVSRSMLPNKYLEIVFCRIGQMDYYDLLII